MSGALFRPLSMPTCCRTLPVTATALSLVAAAASFVVVAVVMNVTHFFILIPVLKGALAPRHPPVCCWRAGTSSCLSWPQQQATLNLGRMPAPGFPATLCTNVCVLDNPVTPLRLIGRMRELCRRQHSCHTLNLKSKKSGSMMT